MHDPLIDRVIDMVRWQPERRSLRGGLIDQQALLENLRKLRLEVDDGVEPVRDPEFFISMRTNTEAFEENYYGEVASVLRGIADAVEKGRYRGNARDRDERTVATWWFQD